MNIKEDINENCFFPICNLCGKILSIDLDLNILYSCQNENYSKKSSYIEFEKTHMKNIKTLNDELINNKNIYHYIYNEKEKNYKNIINNFKNKEDCPKHNYNISEYCKKCKKNICIFCGKEHEKHDRIKYIDIIPSSYKLDYLEQGIKNLEGFFNNIIIELDKWIKEASQTVEKIKKYLKDGILFIKRFYSNFNIKFLDYNYINNFENIYNYLSKDIFSSNSFRDNIKYFYESNNLGRKTEYLSKIFEDINEKDNIQKKIFKDTYKLNNFKFLSYLKDNYFLCRKLGSDELYLFYFFLNDIVLSSKVTINNCDLNYQKLSISISPYTNKIILCLYDSGLYIINYDLNLKQNQLSLVGEISLRKCTYCAEIKTNYYIAINYKNLILYENMNKKIDTESSIYLDIIIPVNQEYFIGSNCKDNNSNVYFYDIETIKEIKKIKCSYSVKNIYKLDKDFVIIIHVDYISLIYIKTKEVVQIIEYFYIYDLPYVYIKNNDIYLLSHHLIYKFEYLPENNDFLSKKVFLEYNDYKNELILLNFSNYENF